MAVAKEELQSVHELVGLVNNSTIEINDIQYEPETLEFLYFSGSYDDKIGKFKGKLGFKVNAIRSLQSCDFTILTFKAIQE